MTFSSRSRRDAEISLTPLIDILFIVLLFLVLTSTFTEQTVLRVTLPGASTGEPSRERVPVFRVLVDAGGRTWLDDRPRTPDQILDRLQALDQPGRAHVLIAADRSASHGSVVQVLDLVRRAGISRVSIQTSAVSAR